MLPVINLKPLYHRSKENIAVIYVINKEIEDAIRQLKEDRYSSTYQCWYLPFSKECYSALKKKLAGKATIYTSNLKAYLKQRKSVLPLLRNNAASKQRAELLIQHPLSEANLQAYKAFQSLLQLKG